MRKITILALFLSLVMPAAVQAQTGEWSKNKELNARLIAGSKGEAALQISLADGWHTYWRIPGDSGLPPMFSWKESKSIDGVEVLWPAPTRKKEYEFCTFGFDKTLTLPLKLVREVGEQGRVLDLKAQVMICKDICIPQRFELNLDLYGPNQEDLTKEDGIIAAAKAKVPTESLEGLTIDSMVAAKNALVVSVTSENGFEGIDAFPVIEEDFMALANPPTIEISDHDPKKAMIKIAAPSDIENLAGTLQGKTLSVTLTHGDKAIVSSVQY